MKGQRFSATKQPAKGLLLNRSGHVQVELSNSTIRQLMIDSPLTGEELHCLNQPSKKVIKRIMLDKLVRSINQNQANT